MSEREWGRISDRAEHPQGDALRVRGAAPDPDRRAVVPAWLLILFSAVGAYLFLQLMFGDGLKVNRCGESCRYDEVDAAMALYRWGASALTILTFAASGWAWHRGRRVAWAPLTGIAALIAVYAVAAGWIDAATPSTGV